MLSHSTSALHCWNDKCKRWNEIVHDDDEYTGFIQACDWEKRESKELLVL